MDPYLGRVPGEKLIHALNKTRYAQATARSFTNSFPALTWEERGPLADMVGPGNGNTRAGNAVTAGRIRAVCTDRSDTSGNTVWIGGVGGGLWKTGNITAPQAIWEVVDDYMANLAISDIVQDPSNPDILYCCSGESYFNADAIAGAGVFKSTDHGRSWNHLPATIPYRYCTRILCDYLGNVYLGTRGNGLLRSTNGGDTWVNITPNGMLYDICDLAISSTTAPGRLHVVSGIFSTQSYRYTDIAAITNNNVGWYVPVTAFPSFSQRAEITCSGNVLYACPVNAAFQVPVIYRSIDGGVNWMATEGQPPSGWVNAQGWYDLAVAIDPSDSQSCIIGALDTWKTINGGVSWFKLSDWTSNPSLPPLTSQYIHADIHNITWYANGNKLLIACDGGLHFSGDKGITFRDRNTGLRIKQFYSVAMHPNIADYFLAGAQDNGSHKLTGGGLGSSIEVTGGDGAFVHIDQDQPQYQFTSYTRNQYRRSIDAGSTWTNVNLSGSTGLFINPTDYDNAANMMYCSNSAGTFRRWNNPQSGSSSDVINVQALNNNTITAVTISPFTPNRVYFGTNAGNGTRVCFVDHANTVTANVQGSVISTGLPANAAISSIAVGMSDNSLMTCFSNYGVRHVWVSTNNGISWTNVDGNLPDMPVRWCMFWPGDDSRALIATETGVWESGLLNGASTTWQANPTFPPVRTDMLEYRASDRMIAAATHGRGLFTGRIPELPVTLNLKFFLQGYYTGNNRMRAVKYDLGLCNDPGATDDITVCLWYPENLSNAQPDHEVQALLRVDGTAVMNFPASVNGKSCYIAVRHRNHLETWSRNPVTFTLFTAYDFSTAQDKAYANAANMPMAALDSTVYAFYCGDINYDGAVDASDMNIADNETGSFAFGYHPADVSGDGATDADDISLIDNNLKLFLYYARPF